MRHRWTDDERDRALAVYAVEGLAAAVAATGVPKGTIASWAHRAGVQTHGTERTAAAIEASRLRWEERRVELVHRMGEVAEQALEVAAAQLEHGTTSRAKDAATTMAILVDKAQLLGGDATARTENRALRDALLDQAREHSRRLRSVA